MKKADAKLARNLKKYHAKRDFKKTREPAGGTRAHERDPIFVIQRHEASHLHYDFRLELDGVLKSWAVPKEPTMDASIKRLAVEVEDHPLEYAKFSGEIPKGEYGGGHVEIWDRGTWQPIDAHPLKGLKAGKLSFTLFGEKLSGRWALVRTRGMKGNSRQNSWLLMKAKESSSRGINKKDLTRKKVQKPAGRAAKKLVLTHPDKVLFGGKPRTTKIDLAEYYGLVQERMLPLVTNRPVSFVRCPAGKEKACFFQQHYQKGLGPGIEPFLLTEAARIKAEHPVITDARGLRSLVQAGVLELHLWGSTTENLQRPDQLVFDFDPSPDVEWRKVVDGLKLLKELLEELELTPFLKLSGGKGAHVHVPLSPEKNWQDVQRFAKHVARELVHREPKLFIATSSKQKRHGLIYLDVQRNSRGATFVAPYSTRARDAAPVAIPISWEELSARIKPNKFTIRNVVAQLKQPDPWAEFFESRGELKQF